MKILLVFFLISNSAFAVCNNPSFSEHISNVENNNLTENSGMDMSKKHKDVFWTLNDANNDAKIFAINLSGKTLGEYELINAKNVDWEDIAVGACLHNNNIDCIYISDSGNNKRDRDSFSIYVVEEPQMLQSISLKVHSEIKFKVKGKYNFEAMSFNENLNEFYFISKNDKRETDVNTSKFFVLSHNSHELEEIAKMDFNKFHSPLGKDDMIVTAMDFSPKDNSILVGTYGKTFEINIQDVKSFTTKAKIIEMPELEKREAITYNESVEGLSLIFSSEGNNQPILQINCNN
jgi:hypothetical protein